MPYCYAPEANQLDGIMRPINPLMGVAGIDEIMSPMIRSDIATPTVDITGAQRQFSMPALNGMGAVQDALSVLSVVDLLTRP